ncbi:MAG: capsular polysaccharide biosynthesis protein [Rhodobacteraceae bacterium]|nr:capsular polysaccharide biosynthesis protein [Paracoccaceae bacterium]
MTGPDPPVAGGAPPRRPFAFTLGLLRPGRVRRILSAALGAPRPGLPRAGDRVLVWGRSPHAARGEAIARARGAALVRVEDAFLRSLLPGRAGAPPWGLILDSRGVHFDAAAPSDLEHLLATHPLDDAPLLARAREGIARIRALDLSKYNLHDPALAAPAPGYVLVLDQTRGDASIAHGRAGAATFAAMIAAARDEHPGARIIIRSHPETALGLRPGHFGPPDAGGRVSILAAPLSPWRLLEGAVAVYAATSLMGFEAILAGHRPVVFGAPFYAGWGLSDDRLGPLPRRGRRLTRAQIFAAAMILLPRWFDPCRDRLCPLEDALDQIEAEVMAFRADRAGHVALGMRAWKRPHLRRFFGRHRPLVFARGEAAAAARAAAGGRGLIVWAGRESPGLAAAAAARGLPLLRIEDGFLRSRGLGAVLVPPLSLVADDLGIYYDPSRESRLERLVATPLTEAARRRADGLAARLVALGITKYNLGGPLPPLPAGRRILVPGQVEDDASIRLGAGEVATNRDLLARVRALNPGAVILYKPHPDVEAGLRPGAVAAGDLARLADAVLAGVDAAAAIMAADEVWTITSGLGFEALLRGRPVTCLGAPFYAGWGLTRDLGRVPARRQARPGLAGLVHAVLVAYPRYVDPATGLPCPPEVALERLAAGPAPVRGPAARLLARAQGGLARHARLWR